MRIQRKKVAIPAEKPAPVAPPGMSIRRRVDGMPPKPVYRVQRGKVAKQGHGAGNWEFLVGWCQGKEAWVIGGDASLIGFNFDLLRDRPNAVVIAVNRIHEVPWCDMFTALDSRMNPASGITNYYADRYVVVSPQFGLEGRGNVAVCNPRGALTDSPGPQIYSSVTSAHLAITAALWGRASHIHVLGVSAAPFIKEHIEDYERYVNWNPWYTEQDRCIKHVKSYLGRNLCIPHHWSLNEEDRYRIDPNCFKHMASSFDAYARYSDRITIHNFLSRIDAIQQVPIAEVPINTSGGIKRPIYVPSLKIRSGFGIGDNIYLQSIVRHLLDKGHKLHVCTTYPDVFAPIANRVTFQPFTKVKVDLVAHYGGRKRNTETDQFEDMCLSAGIHEKVDLRLDWKPRNKGLIDAIKKKANGRKIVFVQHPRTPMGRRDGFGKELSPDYRVMDRIIDLVKDRMLVVKFGQGTPLYNLQKTELDYVNKTTITDMIDAATACDYFVGQCSFIIPLAESLKKPCLILWSSKGLKAPHEYIRLVTPEKILHAETSKWVYDDWPSERIDRSVKEFFR